MQRGAQMVQESNKSQIFAAVIGAGMALAIAVGGFLYQNGQINGHLESLDYREQRIEDKVDMVYAEVVDLRERNARIEERLRNSFSSRASTWPEPLD